MTDYIKREDALDIVADNNVHGEITLNRYDKIIDGIYDIPSADVAPVVRCEDCKFSELFQNDSSGVMARYCKAFTFERMIADNDFCSYGERKDNEIDRR